MRKLLTYGALPISVGAVAFAMLTPGANAAESPDQTVLRCVTKTVTTTAPKYPQINVLTNSCGEALSAELTWYEGGFTTCHVVPANGETRVVRKYWGLHPQVSGAC